MIAKISLELENRELKGTYRYKEVGDQAPVILYLYVRKYAVGKNPPKKITVTIEAE